MDDHTQEAILQVLMQIAQTMQGLRSDMSSGNMSTYGPDPASNKLAHITNMPNDGGLLGMLMKFVPGLHTTDEFGNTVPAFNLNFTTKDSGMSAFSAAVANQNTRSFKAGLAASQQQQRDQWERSVFSDDSVAAKTIDMLVPGGRDNDAIQAIRGLISQEPFASLAMSGIDKLLGYDRGAGVNVSMGRSMGVLAGIDKTAGGIFPEGVEGSNYLEPRRMNWGDFLSDNYNENRMTVQRTIDSAVQDLMYREDETKKGVLTKRGKVHGASETLVTSIVADAMQSGALDEYLRANPMDYQDAASGKSWSMESMADVLMAKKNEQHKYDTAAAHIQELTGDMEEAEKRGDTAAAEKIQSQIKEYNKDLEAASKAIKDIDTMVSRAAEPLVEAVTGTVKALTDFYGSETESKQALDRLTGGQGSHDKAVADRVHDQINEIKVLGMMSGVGAEAMGAQLDAVQQALGGGSARGQRYAGAAALNFQRMFANQIAAFGGNGQQTQELMNAQVERAGSYGESEGNAFATLLEVAKKNGAFEGRDPEELSQIVDLATSGRIEDFQKAKKLLGKIGFGSEAYYDEIANDPAMLAMFSSELTDEERNRAGELGVRMAKAEDSRMSKEGTWSARERRQMLALTEAGIDTSEIENDVGNRDYQSIMDTLDQLGRGQDADEGAATARVMMEREVAAAKKRQPGISDDEARRIAAENFTAKGYDKLLSSQSQDEIQNNRAAARYSALMDAEMFKDKKSGQLYNMQATEFLQNIGAAGSDGSVTRSALYQAAEGLFDFMSENADSGIIRDKNGKEISAEEISKKREQYDKLKREGRDAEAASLVNDLADNMDEDSKKLRDSQLKGSYRTMDQLYMEQAARMSGDDAKKFADLRSIANDTSKSDAERQRARDQMGEMMNKTQQEQDLVDEVMGYGNMAERMSGMSKEDALTYAQAFKDTQNTELSEEDRAEAAKRMREIEAKHEDDTKSDLAKLLEGAAGDADSFAKALSDAGLTVKQFHEIIRGIVEMMGGKVKGPGDETTTPTGSGPTTSEGETWYHSGEKGERNWLGALVTAPGRAVKAVSDTLFGDDSLLSNALGGATAVLDYATGNGEAMEGAQSRRNGISSTHGEGGSGDNGKVDLLCGRIDRLISTLERNGPDVTVHV